MSEIEGAGKILGRFVMRDAPYIVGGLSVMVSAAYAFDIDIPNELGPIQYFLIFGSAYAFGGLMLELFSVTRLITTSVDIQPSQRYIDLYKRWTDLEWKPKPKLSEKIVESDREPSSSEKEGEHSEGLSIYTMIYCQKERAIDHIERAGNLRQLTATIGAAWFVSGFLLLAACILKHSWSIGAVGFFIVVAGVLLMGVSHLHGMSFVQMMWEIWPTVERDIKERKQSKESKKSEDTE